VLLSWNSPFAEDMLLLIRDYPFMGGHAAPQSGLSLCGEHGASQLGQFPCTATRSGHHLLLTKMKLTAGWSTDGQAGITSLGADG